MPKVPVLDDFQVGRQAAPTPNFNPIQTRNYAAEQAQEMGGAVVRAGSEAARVAIDIQERANKVREIEATDQLERARIKLTYDPKGGFVHLKGDNALKPSEDKSLGQMYGDQFDSEISKIENGLANDAQKLAFRQNATRMRLQLNSDLNRHVAQEFETHRKSVFAGAIETSVQGAALEWGDANKVSVHADKARASIGELTSINGVGGKDAEAIMVKGMSQLHSGVTLAAIQAGSLDYARKYLEQNTKELTPEARLQLTKALEQGDKDKVVYAKVDSIWAAAGGDLTKALESAKEVDPKYRKDVESQLRVYDHDKRAVEAADQKRTNDTAWEIVVRDGSRKNLPPGFWGEGGKLNGEEQRQITDWLEAKARQREALAKGKFEPDLDVYSGLVRMSIDEPAEFLKQMGNNPKRLEVHIGDNLTKQLIDRAAGISKNDAAAMQSQNMLKSAMAMVKSEALSAGIDYSPKEGSAAAKEKAKFETALVQELERKVQIKKGPLTQDEIKATAMNMIRTEREQGSGIFGMFAKNRKGYEIPAEEREKFIVKPYKEIPAGAKFDIENAIRRQGRAVTEAEVERAYARAIRAGAYKE